MLVFPIPFDLMPHTEETEQVIRGALHDALHYEDYLEYLRGSQTFMIINKGKMCGFYFEIFYGDCIEIHCFTYPSQRRVGIPLMRWIRSTAEARGVFLETTVFSNFPHIADFLKMNGFKETKRDVGFSTVNGEPIDLIYLTDKEAYNGRR